MKPSRVIEWFSRIVPRRYRAEWKQEWDSEIYYGRLRSRDSELLRRSLGAFWDAMAMQSRRLEDEMFQDFRYGIRMLAKSPGFTFIALLTLAIGIGASTAMFSVVNTVLLRPFPYKEPGSLVFLWTLDAKGGVHEEETSYLTIEDWRQQSRSFADIATFGLNSAFLTDDSSPEPVTSAFISSNLFTLLGVAPSLGRMFAHEEEMRHERLAVLSDGLWRRRFGGASDVIGKTITIDGQQSTIVGVMPKDFYFPAKNVEFWEPTTLMWRYDYFRSRRFHDTWSAIGRLNPGISISSTQTEMNGIAQRMADAIPVPASENGFAGFGVDVVPLLDQLTGRNTRLALWMLLGVVGLLLVIACANIANLLLARGMARDHELAVRTALGAGRLRLIRQLCVESAVLSIAGGVAGLIVAMAVVRAIGAFAPAGIPRLDELHVAPIVLTFTTGLTLVCGLFFGAVGALKTSKADPEIALRSGSRGASKGVSSHRALRVLVVAQCAIAVVLLTATGLMIRSFLNVTSVAAGFDADDVILVHLAFPLARVTPPPVTEGNVRPDPKPQPLARISIPVLFPRLFETLESTPGIRSVAAIDDFFMRRNPEDKVTVEGRPQSAEPSGKLLASQVTPDFFATAGVPLLAGRSFTRDDVGSTASTVVNETFARTYFPEGNAVGRQVRSSRGLHAIVGVVADMRRQGLETTPIAEMFFADLRGTELIIRASSDPARLMPSIRDAIHSVEKNLPITRMETVRRHIDDLNSSRRFETWLLSVFAGIALALSATGLYGIMHYAVAQRTHEIGIRMAVGASRYEVLALVLRQGMILPAAGCVIGLAGALFLTRAISYLLFGISARDPLTLTLILLLLMLVSLFACYVPARRASRVDPLIALRQE